MQLYKIFTRSYDAKNRRWFKINFYSFIDLKTEPDFEKVFHIFDQFYYKFGRFPRHEKLITAPTGDFPSFIETENFPARKLGA